MAIPNKIQGLIQQLHQSLDETEQKAYEGINLVRPFLTLFPDNLMLIRHFAYFNNVVFFVDIARNQVRSVIENFLISDLTAEALQEIGEDLGELLGRVIDAKIGIENFIKTLQSLP